MREFLEGLIATHKAKFFLEEAECLGNPLRDGVRGSPLNCGKALEAVHPVIRTNPITGWKSVFVNKGFTKHINRVTKDKSDLLLPYLFNLITQNHDAQVRFKWRKNDLAIWDNRSTWHCTIYNYEAARAGDRVCSLGEALFLDSSSSSRKEALNIDGNIVGAGVATITYSGSGSPTCVITPQFWGATEPIGGTHGAITYSLIGWKGTNLDGYIYILGSLSSQTTGSNYSNVFAARVAPGSIGTLSDYQYLSGSAYTPTRLTYPVYNGYAPAAVMQQVQAGSIVYNNYYNLYIYLSPGPALSGQILASTSQVPSDPWSNTVVLYQGNTILYAPIAQGYFDTSGRTLTFDMSIFNPIYLQTVKVTFK
ncbi:putative alpha-ketoglutarate-dependent sulfonate dioxygenase [Lachnellula suecica]|uniref:Putative alpha-ketoglutarate-dependent sulfonate dioxygenase n=1 Tax=Lachnellula suecica TaxID=602035 RepID=A0A8T9C6M7_9HELO|nr:putative alpha-ketoglutarate-dependent sulfonate dioxygenase [Lachnellula suecica]